MQNFYRFLFRSHKMTNLPANATLLNRLNMLQHFGPEEFHGNVRTLHNGKTPTARVTIWSIGTALGCAATESLR